MEEIQINNFDDYYQEVEKIKSPKRIFRGLSDKSYKLLPSIGRISKIKNKSEHKTWAVMNGEEGIFDEFQRQCRPFIGYQPSNEWEFLSIAQHNGLPTRFMDWTYRPLFALFFAVENTEKEYLKKDGVVYSIPEISELYVLYDYGRKDLPSPLDPRGVLEGIKDEIINESVLVEQINPKIKRGISSTIELKSSWVIKKDGITIGPKKEMPPFSIDNIKPEDIIKPFGFCPPSISPNISAQESIFTYHFNPSEPTKFIDKKFIINKNSKLNIKKELHNIGIDKKRLFPDLYGLCNYLKCKYFTIYNIK